MRVGADGAEAVQRQLYDAFHLQIRYHRPHHRVTIQVTVSATTVPILADTVTAAISPDGIGSGPATTCQGVHAVGAPGGTCPACTRDEDSGVLVIRGR